MGLQQEELKDVVEGPWRTPHLQWVLHKCPCPALLTFLSSNYFSVLPASPIFLEFFKIKYMLYDFCTFYSMERTLRLMRQMYVGNRACPSLSTSALPTYRGEKKQQFWLGHKMSLNGICKEAFLKIKDLCERKISNTWQREKKN